MSTVPEISVIMGVHNGASHLEPTLDSVLTQCDVDLEFIVVDDGSSDETAEILADRAALDDRLKILSERSNKGLTEALIRGCDAARGEFIARQDCGDRSLPGRLKAQLDFLRRNHEFIGVECGTQFYTPCGLPLYEIARCGRAWQAGLSILDVSRIHGPSHHGATCFRSSTYREAGGYRSYFKVAQDLDLWLRLSELGRLASMPEVLYQAEISPAGISTEKRPYQYAYARQAIESASLRRAGASDREALEAPPAMEARAADPTSIAAGFNYFIGSALLARGNKFSAREYLQKSLKIKPFSIKAWIRFLQASL